MTDGLVRCGQIEADRPGQGQREGRECKVWREQLQKKGRKNPCVPPQVCTYVCMHACACTRANLNRNQPNQLLCQIIRVIKSNWLGKVVSIMYIRTYVRFVLRTKPNHQGSTFIWWWQVSFVPDGKYMISSSYHKGPGPTLAWRHTYSSTNAAQRNTESIHPPPPLRVLN